MGNEIIVKKIYHMQKLLSKLTEILDRPEAEYAENELFIGTAERNFQLLVNLAVDINGIIITDKNINLPDSYADSFLELRKLKVIDEETAEQLADSARLRNILVHEYDFVSIPEKFYASAKAMLPAYEKYIEAIFKFTESNS